MRNLNIKVDNKVINLKIWDTAGQDRYYYLHKDIFKIFSFVILVYAINE